MSDFSGEMVFMSGIVTVSMTETKYSRIGTFCSVAVMLEAEREEVPWMRQGGRIEGWRRDGGRRDTGWRSVGRLCGEWRGKVLGGEGTGR